MHLSNIYNYLKKLLNTTRKLNELSDLCLITFPVTHGHNFLNSFLKFLFLLGSQVNLWPVTHAHRVLDLNAGSSPLRPATTLSSAATWEQWVSNTNQQVDFVNSVLELKDMKSSVCTPSTLPQELNFKVKACLWCLVLT